ncbi:type II toxin-antitoxin system HicB family antitoxin [Desulfofundulus salinus]|uniref:Type II toxin-antitoxin system HicB family antitoxin n=1 Tax=Desulfofundulus salinus TaxID=2419843 RepID=A0A494WYQ2_9FIRM|nr:type II toxin-antitoxin system HicB family antitoxin [Desulfofundulus salinum]
MHTAGAGGVYNSEVIPASLPSVITQGDTREEAFANAREAIACYLEYGRLV